MSFYLVADGHGGASVAELAAQRLLPDIAASEEPLEQAMRAAFLRLHAEALQPEHKGGGSTATVVALDRRNRQVTCGNVGDSLAYLVLSGADGRPVRAVAAGARRRCRACRQARARLRRARRACN